MSDAVETKRTDVIVRTEGGVDNVLTTFDLTIQDGGVVYGSSLAYGLAQALKEQLDGITDDAWKKQIQAWLFPSGELTPTEEPAAHDAVNHPSHYTAYKGIEVIDLTEQLNFNRGNAVKYLARAGLKDPNTEVEDLKKARWYADREIKRVTS